MPVLGVSHFVAATDVLEAQSMSYNSKNGWALAMQAENLVIDLGKAGYLACPQVSHSLQLMRHEKKSPGLEFVGYGQLSENSGHFRIVFGQEGDTDAWVIASLQQQDLPPVAPRIGPENAPPAKFALWVNDIAAAEKFWSEGIGFRFRHEIAAEGRVYKFPNFVCSWQADLILIPGREGQIRQGMLDDAGWNCISLLVDDPFNVGQRLMDYGGTDLTPEIQVSVPGSQGQNTRTLCLRFLRGPHGEIIELLSASSLLDAA